MERTTKQTPQNPNSNIRCCDSRRSPQGDQLQSQQPRNTPSKHDNALRFQEIPRRRSQLQSQPHNTKNIGTAIPGDPRSVSTAIPDHTKHYETNHPTPNKHRHAITVILGTFAGPNRRQIPLKNDIIDKACHIFQ